MRKKLITVILGVLLIVSMAVAQDISDITTTLVSSATDLPAFGTQGAKKVIIFFAMPDSTDTLWTRVTGAGFPGDTYTNLDSNGDTLKYALAQYQDEWAFSVIIEHVSPYMKIEIDSLSYSDAATWNMAAGTRYSDETITIRTVFEY